MFNSLWPHEPQHTRLPCPSLCRIVCSHSCPLSLLCCLTVVSSATPFSFSIFPSIRVLYSESALHIRWPKKLELQDSVLSMNIHGWFPLGLTGFISLQSKGFSGVFSIMTIQKHQFFGAQLVLWSSSHICMWLLKNHSFHYTDLCQQSDVTAF